MTARRRIWHIYREAREPFAALWRWATGHWKRWRALRNWTAARRDVAIKGRKQRRAALDREIKNLEQKRQQADNVHQRLVNVRKELEREEDPARRERLRGRRADLVEELELIRAGIDRNAQRAAVARRQVEDAKARVKFWVEKHTIYDRKWRRARKRHRKTGKAEFETWMLNGCPNTVSDDLRDLIAFVVVDRHQTVTATSNGGHAVGSYHFYSPCRAVDYAGGDMCGCQEAVRSKYGNSFRELFGPCGWYIKNGGVYSGQFPGHADHGHAARNF